MPTTERMDRLSEISCKYYHTIRHRQGLNKCSSLLLLFQGQVKIMGPGGPRLGDFPQGNPVSAQAVPTSYEGYPQRGSRVLTVPPREPDCVFLRHSLCPLTRAGAFVSSHSSELMESLAGCAPGRGELRIRWAGRLGEGRWGGTRA